MSEINPRIVRGSALGGAETQGAPSVPQETAAVTSEEAAAIAALPESPMLSSSLMGAQSPAPATEFEDASPEPNAPRERGSSFALGGLSESEAVEGGDEVFPQRNATNRSNGTPAAGLHDEQSYFAERHVNVELFSHPPSPAETDYYPTAEVRNDDGRPGLPRTSTPTPGTKPRKAVVTVEIYETHPWIRWALVVIAVLVILLEIMSGIWCVFEWGLLDGAFPQFLLHIYSICWSVIILLIEGPSGKAQLLVYSQVGCLATGLGRALYVMWVGTMVWTLARYGPPADTFWEVIDWITIGLGCVYVVISLVMLQQRFFPFPRRRKAPKKNDVSVTLEQQQQV